MYKLTDNKSGFSLIEVLIGITVLTIAIVVAVNMLVGLIRSNENNMKTMQAHYLAVEGIEAVRNVRDGNWLHGKSWLGEADSSPWGSVLGTDEEYFFELNSGFFVETSSNGGDVHTNGLSSLSAPWMISSEGDDFAQVSWIGDPENESGFYRTISIKEFIENDENLNECENSCVLVESKVTWRLGGQERELTISTILTDWKGNIL
jgi:prepilin-type N-terminal cleavage/methylation domain-containing protein